MKAQRKFKRRKLPPCSVVTEYFYQIQHDENILLDEKIAALKILRPSVYRIKYKEV